MLGKPVPEFRRRQRPAHQVALDRVAAQSSQGGALLFGFDAFGDHEKLQIVCNGDHRLDEAVVRAGAQSLDEGAIDLEFAYRKLFQALQRRIAGAEIIQREMKSGGIQCTDLARCIFQVMQEDVLGDFQGVRCLLAR